jgi:ribonuclease inhibitor
MHSCRLNGDTIHSKEDFYDCLARELSLPGYFGHNLDALWDMLTATVEGPIALIWEHSETSEHAMPEDFAQIKQVLMDAAQERRDLTIEIR